MFDEVEAGQRLWELEQERKALETKADEKKKEYTALANELTNYLIEEGKTSTGFIKGVGDFALRSKSYLSVTKANMPKYIDHLKEQGNGALVTETVPEKTLKCHLESEAELIASCVAEAREAGGVRQMLNYIYEAYPIAETTDLADLTDDELETIGADKVANMVLQGFGASTFNELKLSHTKKGKTA